MRANNGGEGQGEAGIGETRRDTPHPGKRWRGEGKRGEGGGWCLVAAIPTQQEKMVRCLGGEGGRPREAAKSWGLQLREHLVVDCGVKFGRSDRSS